MVIKTVAVLLVSLALPSVHLGEAQQQAKVATIGWLGNRPNSGEAVAGRGTVVLRQMLAELGYIEGKNIAFEFRFADKSLTGSPPSPTS
jgi:hypothetical protein